MYVHYIFFYNDKKTKYYTVIAQIKLPFYSMLIIVALIECLFAKDDKGLKYYHEGEFKKAIQFYESIKRYLEIEIEDLSPAMSGIRPKLQSQNENFRDFIIKNETNLGYNNFINLIGIESPGLTSSLAIAKYVKNIIH